MQKERKRNQKKEKLYPKGGPSFLIKYQKRRGKDTVRGVAPETPL